MKIANSSKFAAEPFAAHLAAKAAATDRPKADAIAQPGGGVTYTSACPSHARAGFSLRGTWDLRGFGRTLGSLLSVLVAG